MAFHPQRERIRCHRIPATTSPARAPPPRGEQRPAERHRGRDRKDAGRGREEPHAEDRRAEKKKAGAVELQVQDAHAPVRPGQTEWDAAYRIGEIAQAAVKRERGDDERHVVHPQDGRQAVQGREPRGGAGGERRSSEEDDRSRGERQPRKVLADRPRPPPEKEGRRHHHARSHRDGNHTERQEDPRQGPGGIRIEEESRPDGRDEKDPNGERGARSGQDGRAAPLQFTGSRSSSPASAAIGASSTVHRS